MQRQRGELVPVGEVFSDLGGPVKAIREAGIVKLTGCRGTKPPYRVFRCGLTTDILWLSQLVMR